LTGASLSTASADNAPIGAADHKSRLDSFAKILYGVGEIGSSIRLVVFGLFLFFFYTTVLGLPGRLVAAAQVVGLLWNAVVDPYVGHLSDRTSIWLGRRHGFMLVGAATSGISFWLLFNPPRELSAELLFVWLLVTSLVVRFVSSVFGIPYRALGAELSSDVLERNSVAGIRGACGLIGFLIAATLVFVVFFPNTLPGVDPKLDFARYPTMGLAFGAFITLVQLVSTITTLHLRNRLVLVTTATVTLREFVQGLVLALRALAFRVLLASTTLLWFGLVINSLLFVHFLTYYVQIADSRALSLLQFSFYGSATLAIPVWLQVTKRVEKRWLFFTATMVTATLMIAARFLVGPGHLFGVGDVRPLLVGEALAGFFASLYFILPASMMADAADADELLSGRRREGTLFGLSSFTEQIAGGIAFLAAGFLVDGFAGLVAGQAEQSAVTVERIGMLYGVLPATALLTAGVLILWYPLDRRRLREIQAGANSLSLESAPANSASV
jgi:GPH family glycoside/pentoside/hexuronide:cation symporter